MNNLENQFEAPIQSSEEVQKLRNAYKVKKDVDNFARIMDKYGVDGLTGLFVGAGDLISGGLSTAYLLKKGKEIGLSGKDKRKIVFKKIKDTLIGSIPVLGDIFDFFYRSNVKSSELFDKKLQELEQEARSKGVDENTIYKLKEEMKLVKKYTEKTRDIKNTTKGKVSGIIG